MKSIFSTMTKDEALKYCYKHEAMYKADIYLSGENGARHFDCLIDLVESDTITGADLPEYGMDYEEE